MFALPDVHLPWRFTSGKALYLLIFAPICAPKALEIAAFRADSPRFGGLLPPERVLLSRFAYRKSRSWDRNCRGVGKIIPQSPSLCRPPYANDRILSPPHRILSAQE